jgi:hypothetical protein
LAAWTTVAIACATLVQEATRSLLASVTVLVGVFLYLWIMANEPTHPGGIIIVLTSLLAVLGYRWIVAGKAQRWSVMIGAAGAALLLTKVNIGIFVFFSAAAWWLIYNTNAAIRRWSPLILTACAIVMVLALMRPLLGTPWVRTFAFVFAFSGFAIFLATASEAVGKVGWPEFKLAVFAACSVAGVVTGAVLFRGTSLSNIVHGVLLGPMGHPTVYSARFPWPAGIEVLAIVSAAVGVIAFQLKKRLRLAIDVMVVVVRLAAAAGLAWSILRFPSVSPDHLVFGGALPFLWFFAWPLSGENAASTAARGWVVLLLLGQSLHAFPVPGSQIAWGTLLAVPLAAIGTWESLEWLKQRGASRWSLFRPLPAAYGVLAVAFTVLTAWKFGDLAARYRDGKNLALPGAELIRIPDKAAALCRLLAYNAAVHGDLLFSLPGTFSFNLWSGLPTPTHANVTHWFSLLDEPQQTSIIRELELHPRACVILWRGHVNFLAKRGLAPKGPLYDYIHRAFEPAFSIEDVEFCVRRGRRINPVMLAELTQLAEANGSATSRLLTLTVLPPPTQPVSRIEISTDTGSRTSLQLTASNARVAVSPVNERGQPSGPPATAEWPLRVSTPSKLWIRFNSQGVPPLSTEATIVLRDVHGEEVGLARLLR